MAGFRSAAFWLGRSIGGDAPQPPEILGGHFVEKDRPKKKRKTPRESIEEVLSPLVIAEQVREALEAPEQPRFQAPDLSDVKEALGRVETFLQDQEAKDAKRKRSALRILMLDL